MAGSRELAGRTALVTGASRGIGAECARALAQAGADLLLVARSRDALDRLALALSDRGVRATAHPCDLANPDAVPALLQAMRASLGGAPDIVVNNAATFVVSPLEDTAIDDIKTAIRLNLATPFLIVRAFLGDMKARGSGDIVTIGSEADREPRLGNALYAATKYGARGMHEVLREETRGSGVRATLVSPGPVDTGIWDLIDPDARPALTPRARMLPAAAVADVVRFVVTRPADVDIDEVRLSRA